MLFYGGSFAIKFPNKVDMPLKRRIQTKPNQSQKQS